jgi:carboxypeptidase family protein
VPRRSLVSEDKTDVTIQPGDSATVDVSLDAGTITQPGTYDAHLTVSAKTPYGTSPLPVSLTVNPPKTWSKITGTVTGVGWVGTPAPLAATTVQINAKAAAYTLKTDRNGQYTLWLDSHDNPLTVIASKDGWTPQTASVKITPQKTTTTDFPLKPDHACS